MKSGDRSLQICRLTRRGEAPLLHKNSLREPLVSRHFRRSGISCSKPIARDSMDHRRQALNATTLLVGLFAGSLALAEVRMITATGEYRMGDNDTRTDAKRLALLDAKRQALEQVGTYLEGVTEVKNLRVTKDEIRSYTAGIVEVVEQATRTTLEGETTVVRVDVTVKVDTAVVTRQLGELRKNE